MDLSNNRIKEVMKKRDIIQEDLEKMTGITQGELSLIIAGKKKRVTFINIAKISIALGYSVEYLWPGVFK